MRFTRSKKVVGGVALAAAFVFGSTVGVAQQPGSGQGGEKQGRHWGQKGGGKGHKGMRGGRGFLGGRMAERLNLNDSQKEQLQQISARYRESMKALRTQGGHTRGGAAFDGTFDESAVRAAAQARANASVELAVLRARMMSEMYNVLTPEQRAQLAAERQQRRQRQQERQQRRSTQGGGASRTE